MLIHTSEKGANTQAETPTWPTLLIPAIDNHLRLLECALTAGFTQFKLITNRKACPSPDFEGVSALKTSYENSNILIQDISDLSSCPATQSILVLTETLTDHKCLVALALDKKITILIAMTSAEAILGMRINPNAAETQLFFNNPDNWTKNALIKYIVGHHTFWGKTIRWSGQIGASKESAPRHWIKAALAVQLLLNHVESDPLKSFPEHYALQMPEF